MKQTKYRLLSEGQFPDSDGGIFNPGVVAHDTWVRQLLVRVEPYHAYSNDSTVTLIVEKTDKLKAGEIDGIYHLQKVGYPPHSKIEDFRLFMYNGELYAIHTMCVTKRGWEDATLIKPVISRVTRTTIELVDYCDLPYVPRKIGEKNWLPIVHNGGLYILYGLDPLRMFKLEGWSWREVKIEDTNLALHVKEMLPESSFLSLSAITQLEGSTWLGFWHVRHNDKIEGWLYKQGMFTLNMDTLKIEHFTPPVLQGGGLDGNRPDCLYVSGIVATPTLIEVYAGEADSHTVLIELNREEVVQALNAHPYKYTAPIKILMKDRGVGDFICAAYAIMGWMIGNNRKAKIYVTQNLQLASALKIPGVTVVSYTGQPVDIDLSSNEDSLPEGQRKEYKEKISGSLKGFYAKKLKTSPYRLPVTHIKPMDGVSDAIVLFPFVGPPDSIRDWGLNNWIKLSDTLLSLGKRVIICDNFPARCKNIPGEHKTGMALIEVLSLIKGCGMVVCHESGGGHMAGLFDTKTVVLSGWLDPKVVYDMTNNDYIFKTPLRNITVEEVIEKIDSIWKK